MFLKTLEIQGFKSFNQKVTLNFKKGITSIVGPNGSGKSNISDAIRWVIGEQSIKNLRGEKMEDVIFSGTDNRKPLGFAQVSITIDNTEKKLNSDFDFITITRKIYRSGESQYYINNSNCRLKDVYEIFMDTGIGKEGYSIIGQGKIDSILSNKSEERRILFEEAVGIIKFKNRKLQTQNKLNLTKENLTRIEDTILEIKNQLEPLKKQAEKTKIYNNLSQDLKKIKLNLFIRKYQKYEKILQDFEIQINKKEFHYRDLLEEKQLLIQNQDELKNKIYLIEEELCKLNSSFTYVFNDITKNKEKINLNIQSMDFINNEINKINSEIDLLIKKIENNKDIIALQKNTLNNKNVELLKQIDTLNILEEDFKKTNEILNQNQNLIYFNTQKINQKNNDLIEVKGKISKILLNQQNKKQLLEQYNDSININKSYLEERKTRNIVLEKELKNNQINIQDLQLKLDKIKQNIDKVSLENKNLFNQKQELEKDLILFKNRKKILEELQYNLEGYYDSVKFILKQKNNIGQIFGTVADIISTSPEFEIAVETAILPYIQNIVTKTEEDAKKAIEILRKFNKGRVTFLPLSSIKPKELQDISLIKNEKGFISICSKVVEFEPIYFNIISNLLGKVLIFDNLDNSIIFSKKYNYKYKIVTLCGNIINPGGALTGGSNKKKTNIINRNREIAQLQIKIQENSISFEKLKFKSIEKQNELQILNKELSILTQEINQIEFENDKIKIQIKENLNNICEYEKNIEQLYNNIYLYNQDDNNESKDLQIYTNNQKDLELQIKDLEENINSYQLDLNKQKDFYSQKIDKIGNIKIEINSIEHNIKNLELEISRLENENLENMQKKLNLENQLKSSYLKIQEIENTNNNLEQRIQCLTQEHDNFFIKQDKLQEEKNNLQDNLSNQTNYIINITNNIQNINDEKATLQLSKQEIELKSKQLSDNIWEEYEISFATAFEEFFDKTKTDEYLKKTEQKLKKDLINLGTINPLAIEEYSNLKSRYDLNLFQRDDILLANKHLEEMLQQLNEQMENQFKSQFEIINKNFAEVFSQIFGGGTAKLVLLDNDNVLTSGIDIVAKPPGKTLQSLNLLSGGERTLTAISILFAILKLKPSPFCILDEIEAALDDSNVIRYANFLKKFSNQNQFIIITHKIGTMEVSDALYGVTMEEQGLSKLVSVKLEEASNLV